MPSHAAFADVIPISHISIGFYRPDSGLAWDENHMEENRWVIFAKLAQSLAVESSPDDSLSAIPLVSCTGQS